MSLTYGFYDSDDGDRKYDSRQISKIFDGLISDGVYQTYGGCMMVKVDDEGENLLIDTGRAWFNHTWNYNDSIYMIDVQDFVPEPLTGSIYYAVVLQIDIPNRTNTFEVISGNMATDPVKPELIKDGKVFQYPLAYIRRTWSRDHENLTQANVENAVGTSECPFVCALVDPAFNLDDLIGDLKEQYRNDIDGDINLLRSQLQDALRNIAGFEAETTTDILNWYQNLTVQINENAAVNLQNQIGSLENLKTYEKNSLVHAVNETRFLDNYRNAYPFTPWRGSSLTNYVSKKEIQDAGLDGFDEFDGLSEVLLLNIGKKRPPLGKNYSTDETDFSDDIYLHPGDTFICTTLDPSSMSPKSSRWIQSTNFEGFQIGKRNITIQTIDDSNRVQFHNENSDGVINRIIPANLIGNDTKTEDSRYPADQYIFETLVDGDANVYQNIIGYPYYRSGITTFLLVYLGMLEYNTKTYRIFSDITNPGLSELNPSYALKTNEYPPLDAIVTRRFIDAMYGDLLWRNLTPTVDFPAKTIYLDDFENGGLMSDASMVTEYDHYIVDWQLNKNTRSVRSDKIYYRDIVMYIDHPHTDNNNDHRTINIKSDGSVVFTGGLYGTGGNNTVLIPLRIVGMKHSGLVSKRDS